MESKKQKHKYNNWFEKLTVTELKSLCRASKLAVSGTKDELCIRLCTGDLSRAYAYEYAPQRFSMSMFDMGDYPWDDDWGRTINTPSQQGSKRSSAYSNKQLKEMCREKGLIVSGKRFDLVLRLLQTESGVGGQPKRAAGTMDEKTGVFQPKKRAKSMKPPNVEKLRERIFKKCFPPAEVKHKWSNMKYKYHFSDCMSYMDNIIQKEIFEKELFERGEEKCAWELINAMLHIITVGDKARRDDRIAQHSGEGLFFMIGGTDFYLGYCSDDLKFHFLPSLVKAMKATSSKSVVEKLSGKYLWAFQSKKLAEIDDWDKFDIGDGWGLSIKDRKWGSFKQILNEYAPGESSTEKSDDKEESQMRFISILSIPGEPDKKEELIYSEETGFVTVGAEQVEGGVSADIAVNLP